ncbi:MAG: (d)CMP kinase [Halieaceae bacterium]|nr:(d)CMP kinase [Halieaceae bacterium]
MWANIITVDGPSGAGKGAIATRLADLLGWHLLDSGALYRTTAHACARAGVELTDHQQVADIARHLQVEFLRSAEESVAVYLQGEDISRVIRSEEAGRGASAVGAMPAVRRALLERQRDFLRPPGLIADGRDMGTVVFPSAALKIFLVASVEERAQRRFRQLLALGENVTFARLLRDMEERDERDRSRSLSPLEPADDAVVIDSTATPIDAVLAKVMAEVNRVYSER